MLKSKSESHYSKKAFSPAIKFEKKLIIFVDSTAGVSIINSVFELSDIETTQQEIEISLKKSRKNLKKRVDKIILIGTINNTI